VPWPENTQFGGQLLGFAGSYTAQHAISPDGRHIAMVAQTGGKDSLWLRTVATLGIRELPGTDLCDAPQAAGGSWNRDNVIVFATSAKPLHRVSSAGGTPVALTQLDRTYGETSHRWPHFLPDHRHFAFTAVTGGADIAPKPSVVKIGSLDSTDAVALFNAESAVAYADGHLLFLAGDSLMAQPFDPGMRQFTGDPFPVAEDVDRSGSRYASFSVSPGGTLVYAHDVWNASVLQWFDRSGQPLGQVGEPADYQHVSLSPDERRVAAAIGTGLPGNVGRNIDIWTIDVARNVTSRLTSGPTRENTPVWSPDSLRVLFSSTQGQADVGLHQKVWTGASEEEVVLKGDRGRREFLFASDWSPDGRSIVYSLSSGSPGQGDIWILPLFGDRNRSHSCRAPVGTTTGRSHPMASGSRIPPSMAIRRRSLCSPSRRHAPELRCRETAACSRSGEAMARSGEAMAKSCTSWPRTAA
jgi:hypothetical protein